MDVDAGDNAIRVVDLTGQAFLVWLDPRGGINVQSQKSKQGNARSLVMRHRFCNSTRIVAEGPDDDDGMGEALTFGFDLR
jgi:hypothetical protein